MCAGFWLVYSLYVLVLTSLGSVLMAFPARLAMDYVRRQSVGKSNGSGVHLRVDFSPMYDLPFVLFALLGVAAIVIYAWGEWTRAALLFALALFQGCAVAVFLLVRRRYVYLEAGLLLHSDTQEDIRRKQKATSVAQRVLIGVIILAPMIAGPERFSLVDAAFRTAQLRKEKAVIHVKKPWATRVASSTLVPGASFLGDEYQEFRGVKVLLRSVGEKVVIELPQETGVAIKLPVPSSEIFVE
ncbi:hypothetical protein D3C85_1255720 [compost metagenome]